MGNPGSNKPKCESNRTSKKNSPNNTISNSKGTLNIREARTKPTSPERSLVLINSYNNQSKQNNPHVYLAGSHVVNQREERKALNMISNIPNKTENQSSLSQNQRIETLKQSKRKNFKNMFYSPKNNRDVFTEPHSKVASQAQTKEHSPANKLEQVKNNTIGHHPKLRASAKPPTQLKSKNMYSTKDSNNKSKLQDNFEGVVGTNSFLEDSYMKNIANFGAKKDDASFDSSSNHFSQTGTPLSYQVKINKV